MDDDTFMSSVIEDMDDAELEAYCEVLVEEMNMSDRKENKDE